MSEEEPEYRLVMPFLPVRSKGGPHDDAAFTTGWEMGTLDAQLAVGAPPQSPLTIHAENAGQADLIAMRHGYSATTEASMVDEYVTLHLTPTGGL